MNVVTIAHNSLNLPTLNDILSNYNIVTQLYDRVLVKINIPSQNEQHHAQSLSIPIGAE